MNLGDPKVSMEWECKTDTLTGKSVWVVNSIWNEETIDKVEDEKPWLDHPIYVDDVEVVDLLGKNELFEPVCYDSSSIKEDELFQKSGRSEVQLRRISPNAPHLEDSPPKSCESRTLGYLPKLGRSRDCVGGRKPLFCGGLAGFLQPCVESGIVEASVVKSSWSTQVFLRSFSLLMWLKDGISMKMSTQEVHDVFPTIGSEYEDPFLYGVDCKVQRIARMNQVFKTFIGPFNKVFFDDVFDIKRSCLQFKVFIVHKAEDYGIYAIFNMDDLSPYLDDYVRAELRSIHFKGGGDDTNTTH